MIIAAADTDGREEYVSAPIVKGGNAPPVLVFSILSHVL